MDFYAFPLLHFQYTPVLDCVVCLECVDSYCNYIFLLCIFLKKIWSENKSIFLIISYRNASWPTHHYPFIGFSADRWRYL